MTFDELCKDLERRKPSGKPVSDGVPWFSVRWENGNDSINDLLRRGLREYEHPYVNTFNGDVWFLYYDNWKCATYEVKERDGAKWVHFYLCVFE